ncbi:MAG: hypothetical protein RR252_06090 [Longicatena sp.]
MKLDEQRIAAQFVQEDGSDDTRQQHAIVVEETLSIEEGKVLAHKVADILGNHTHTKENREEIFNIILKAYWDVES